MCDPCKAEAPILEQTQRSLARRNGTILGVTYLDNSSDSEQFVRQWHLTYPVVRDVSGNFVRGFGTTGVPETFVINRAGHVVAVRRFQLDDTWLQRTLPRVLAKYVAEVSSASDGAVTRPPEYLDVPAGSPQGGSTLGEGQRHG